MLMVGLLLLWPRLLHAQTPATPAADAVCVVSALNRNATLDGGYYLIPGVPSLLGQYRVRAVCSDGSVGETGIVKPAGGNAFVAGPVVWGKSSPIPKSLAMDGPGSVSYGQAVQFSVTAKGVDGATWNASNGVSGTNYVSSNPGLASISADGMLTVPVPYYGQNTGRQVVISATNEGTTVSRLINIGPRGAIAGKVTLADGVTPVAGAQVTIQLGAPLTRFPLATTDAGGAFRLADAPAGEYTLSVLAPATGARATASGTLAASGATANFQIKLSGQGTVRVTATSGGQPAAGAQVTLAHAQYAGEVRSAQAGADGVASFQGFSAGRFGVTVRAAGDGALASANGELQAGAVADIAVQLQGAGTIGGRVLQAGAAQGGIQVRLLSAGKGLVTQAMSAADGQFRFDSLLLGDGPYTLQALRSGQLQGSVGALVLAAPGQELVQNIELGSFAAGGSVTGKVLDASGQRLSGIEVRLATAGGQQFVARTDAQGVYLLAGVPLGEFTLTASLDRLAATAKGKLETNGEQRSIDLRLAGSGDISGTLLLSSGQSAAGASVELRHASGVTQQLLADAGGAFVFSGVPTGSYVLEVRHAASGELARVPGGLVAAGDTRQHRLTLTGLGTLRVQVNDWGSPVAGARVALALQGALAEGREAVTDAAGVAEFTAVPRVAYGITATRGGRFARASGQLSAGSTSVPMAFDYTYLGQYSVRGRVLDAMGRPVPNGWVRLSTRDMPLGGTAVIANPAWNEYLVRSDASGNYSFDNVTLQDDGRGRLKLDALVDGALRGRVILNTPSEGAVAEQDIVLYDAGTVAGVFRSHKNKTIAGSSVSLAGFDDYIFATGDFTALPDAAGLYAVPAPVGDYIVNAVTPDVAVQGSLPRSVRAAGEAVGADFVLETGAASLRTRVSNGSGGSTTLEIDGKYVATRYGSGSFADVGLKAGVHSLRLSTEYGDAQTRQVTVLDSDTIPLIEEVFAFDPTRLTVNVAYAAPNVSWSLAIDGRYIGTSYGASLSSWVGPGAHAVTVTAAYGESKTQQVSLGSEQAGKNVETAFAFTPTYLRVRVVAPNASTTVAINGVQVYNNWGNWENVFFGLKQGTNLVSATSNGQTRTVQLEVGALNDGRGYDAGFSFGATMANIRIDNPVASSYTYVYDNGQWLGARYGSGLLAPVALGEGVHTLQATNDYGLVATSTVTVKPTDEKVDVVLSFLRPQLKVGMVNGLPQAVSKIRLNGKEIGSITGSGTLVDYTIRQGSNDVVAINDDGDMQRLTLNVPALTNGLVVEANFVFDQASQKHATLGFSGERHLYAVAVKPGDVVAVSAHGSAYSGQAAIAGLRAEVYAPGLALAASGIVTGEPFNYSLIRLQGNLGAIPVQQDGYATIAVEASTAGASGAYMVSAAINGQPVQLLPYQGGAGVEGRVLRGDGVTPAAGQVLALRSAAPTSHTRVVSDAAGRYRFENVPLGAFALNALAGEQVVVQATATLDTIGQALAQDVQLPTLTQLQVSVTVDEALPLPSSMNVEISDSTGTRSEGPLGFDAGRTSGVLATSVTGASFTLTAVHPYDSAYRVTRTLAAADGETVAVNLELRGAQLTGRVLFGNGSPAPYYEVSALRANTMTLLRSATTDNQGRYSMAVPAGIDLIVRVYDYRSGNYVALPVAAGTIGVPDLLLGSTGTLRGLVRSDKGEPMPWTSIEVSGSVGGNPFTLYNSSEEDGRFRIDDVPAGVPLTVTATAGAFNVRQSQDATVGAGQVLELPAFVFAAGTRLTVRLLDGEGKPDNVLTGSNGECSTFRVLLRSASGMLELRSEWLEPVTGLAPGPVEVELRDLCGRDDAPPLARAAMTLDGAPEATLDLLVPILHGTMTYADGRLVRYPSVLLTQTLKDGAVKNLYETWRDSGEYDSTFGRYQVVGVEPGDYTLKSRMEDGSVNVEVQGTLAAMGNPRADLVLPARPYDGSSSDVIGRVLVEGMPIPDFDVRLVYPNGWSHLTRTNEQGVFQFAEVPAGSYTVTAENESGPVSVTVAAGGAPVVTHDLALAAPPWQGGPFDLTGVVTVDGLPTAGVKVTANVNPSPMLMAQPQGGATAASFSASYGNVTTLTDADGKYVFRSLQGGTTTVTARHSWDAATGRVTPTGAAMALDLAIVSQAFDGTASAVKGKVTMDGEARSGAEVQLERDGGVVTAYTDEAGEYQFDRVAAGPFTLTAMLEGSAASASGVAGATQFVIMDLAVPRLTAGVRVAGTVRYKTGEAAQSVSVTLYQNGRTYYGDSFGGGAYAVEGVQPGGFEITAQDDESSLSATVAGTAGDAAIALDVTLPPAGSLSGTALDGAGQPAPWAYVYVTSSGAPDISRYAQTDEAGRYSVAHLALGTVHVGLMGMDSSLAASGSVVLGTNGQAGVLDLQMPVAPAVVAGRVLDAGGAPVTEYVVELTTQQVYGPLGSLWLSTYAEADGSFRFKAVPPGGVRIAISGYDGSVLAVADRPTLAGETLSLDLVTGPGRPRYPAYAGLDGRQYGFSCYGALERSGTADQSEYLPEFLGLELNAVEFPCIVAATAAADARQFAYGPVTLDGTQVTRKVFAPEAGGYVRQIDTFTNPGASPVTVKVRYGKYSNGYNLTLVTNPAATGQTYAVYANPAFAQVSGGVGVPVPANSFVYEKGNANDANSGRLLYTRSLTIQPGASVSLMHYSVQSADAQTTLAMAKALSNQTAPSMFDQIAPAEKATIINFAVP